MKHHCQRTLSLKKIPQEKPNKNSTSLSMYAQSQAHHKTIDPDKAQAVKSYSKKLSELPASILRSKVSLRSNISLNCSFDYLSSISSTRLQNKAKSFHYKLEDAFGSLTSNNSTQQIKYELCIKYYQEIAEILKPFDVILRMLLEKIESYWLQTTEIGVITEQKRKLEEINKRLSEELTIKTKEKGRLITKLNRCSADLQKISVENNVLQERILNYEKSFGRRFDITVDSEKLINNMLEQYEKLQLQKEEIEDFKIEEIKYHRTIEALRGRFKDIDDIILEINN